MRCRSWRSGSRAANMGRVRLPAAARALLLCAPLAACAKPPPPAAPAPAPAAETPARDPDGGKSVKSVKSTLGGPLPDNVGVATMAKDGTITLDLRSAEGAETRVVYPPSHPQYRAIKDHI